MAMSAKKATAKSNVVTIEPIQCRLGRTALGWGVRDLAREADVSPNTVARFERGEIMLAETIQRLETVMESAGVEFIPENGGGPGVRLAKRKGKR
jgi:transcriptional regulator with XRE-family HTH domain